MTKKKLLLWCKQIDESHIVYSIGSGAYPSIRCSHKSKSKLPVMWRDQRGACFILLHVIPHTENFTHYNCSQVAIFILWCKEIEGAMCCAFSYSVLCITYQSPCSCGYDGNTSPPCDEKDTKTRVMQQQCLCSSTYPSYISSGDADQNCPKISNEGKIL